MEEMSTWRRYFVYRRDDFLRLKTSVVSENMTSYWGVAQSSIAALLSPNLIFFHLHIFSTVSCEPSLCSLSTSKAYRWVLWFPASYAQWSLPLVTWSFCNSQASLSRWLALWSRPRSTAWGWPRNCVHPITSSCFVPLIDGLHDADLARGLCWSCMKVCLTTLLNPLRTALPCSYCRGSSRMHITLAPYMVCAGSRMMDFRKITSTGGRLRRRWLRLLSE